MGKERAQGENVFLSPLRVFMITSEWPTPENPHYVPFIVRQVSFLRQTGVKLRLFKFRGGKNPLSYARAWRRVRRELAQGNYDLVHAQWGQSGLLALPKTLPLVVTFRGDDLEGIIGPNGRQTWQGRVLKKVSRLVARNADQVIVVSESLGRILPERPYHLIPSGLDLNLFCPAPQHEARERLRLEKQRKYVLFAGAASNPRKRYGLAVQAVDRLRSVMDIDLLSVTNLQQEMVPDFMNASDALLLTSIHEGSPNVVKEALACNLPVVSTDVGDVRERINGIEGCVVLEDDRPETIVEGLRQALRGERADSRSTVLDLDENLLTQKVIGVYRQALSGRKQTE